MTSRLSIARTYSAKLAGLAFDALLIGAEGLLELVAPSDVPEPVFSDGPLLSDGAVKWMSDSGGEYSLTDPAAGDASSLGAPAAVSPAAHVASPRGAAGHPDFPVIDPGELRDAAEWIDIVKQYALADRLREYAYALTAFDLSK